MQKKKAGEGGLIFFCFVCLSACLCLTIFAPPPAGVRCEKVVTKSKKEALNFYSCAFQLYSLHRELLSENVFYANICTKQVQLMANVLFYGAYGVCVVRVDSVLNSGMFFGTNKCRSQCFSYLYYTTTVHL